MMDKAQLKNAVISQLQKQIQSLQHQINALTLDAQNEAKSSAGDKHETGLAMMHLEQEKLAAKLQQQLHVLSTAQKIPTDVIHKKVGLGSVVQTNFGVFFIGVSLQPFVFQGEKVFCVSPQAPLVQHLTGKQVNAEILFNGLTYKISQIF